MYLLVPTHVEIQLGLDWIHTLVLDVLRLFLSRLKKKFKININKFQILPLTAFLKLIYYYFKISPAVNNIVSIQMQEANEEDDNQI